MFKSNARAVCLAAAALLALPAAFFAAEGGPPPAGHVMAPQADGGGSGDGGETDPAAFVQKIYRKLEGQRPDIPALAAALDTDMLLDRVTGDLTALPPDTWLEAARQRLAGEKLQAAAWFFPRNSMVIRPRVIGQARETGPDASMVTVRYYGLGTQGPVWHQVHLRRAPEGWRVADIEHVEAGLALSQLAVSRLNDPADEPLPGSDPGGVAVLLLGRLVPGIGAALVLGLACWLLLARPRRIGGARFLTVLAIVLPLLAGGIAFLAGLSAHLDRTGAVEELARRARSRMMTGQAEEGADRAEQMRQQGNVDESGSYLGQAVEICEAALRLWPQNRQAVLLRARLLGAGSARGEAEQYLQALTGAGMEPPLPAAWLEMARMHQRARNWRRAAEAHYGFAAAVGPDAVVFATAAQCLALGGDLQGAELALKEARAAQEFDKAGSADYDDTLVIGRAAVRAAQKRVPDVIADLRLFLSPYEDQPAAWFQRCMELSRNLQGGQFEAIMKDAAFQEYLKGLETRMREVIKKQGGELQAVPAPGLEEDMGGE